MPNQDNTDRQNELDGLLLIAIEKGRMEDSREFLIAGANPNITNQEGLPILNIAYKNQKADLFYLLLEHGAHLAPFVKNGGTIDWKDEDDVSPLQLAIEGRRYDIINEFVKNGVKGSFLKSYIDFDRMIYGRTLLHHAVDHKHLELIKFLIKEGAIVDIADSKNLETPLDIALKKNDFSYVRKLLDIGGFDESMKMRDYTIEDFKKGIIPLIDLGMTEEFNKLLEKNDLNKIYYLEHRGVKTTLLKVAIYYDNYEITKLLLERGVDINEIAEDGTTPLDDLEDCIEDNRIKMLLIRNGAKYSRDI